jgi:Tfp pilus assembly protein PilF
VAIAPLAFLGLLEASLRVAGIGHPATFFIPDAKPGYLRTNPDFTRTFFPPQFDITPLAFSLSRHKEHGHTRIFVLGESAARGIPEPGFGFAALLRAQLRAAYPGRSFDVYNLGVVAINSHVVYQIAEEAAALEPDLLVIYMGNNEVVGPFGPGSATHSAMPPLPLIRASIWTARTRTGQLVARAIGKATGRGADATQWRGMTTFVEKTVRGDDPRLASVYDHFHANLDGILTLARARGIPTVISTVVANLKDCPPFASLHTPGLAADRMSAWQSSFSDGANALELGDAAGAERSLGQALRIDPGYADTHFLLARALELQGDASGSRREYLQALHWDALRFRPDTPVNDIIRGAASGSPGRVRLVDAALDLGSAPLSTVAPSGSSILWEHVHLNLSGDLRLARMLAEAASRELFGESPPPEPWLTDDQCAAAVGYSPQGRYQMLMGMEAILSRPPFTNQLTFAEDQLRFARDLASAAAEAKASAATRGSEPALNEALQRDPENPDLWERLSEVQFASDDPGRALASIDKALALAPPKPELQVRRAHTLAALGRYREAQAAILGALAGAPNHLPAYAELVAILRKTGDFETGRAQLGRALQENPRSDFLRLQWADLLFFHGDKLEAELECRTVLTRDPRSAEALGRLVSLFAGDSRSDEAFKLMVEARRSQPGNFTNDMALAHAYQERHQDEDVAECLDLAAQSGPAEPQVHVFLGRRLSAMNLPKQAMLEFARARRGALIEGNQKMADAMAETIAQLAARN